MKELFSFWGCGNGPVKYLQPQSRVLAGLFVASSCLLMPLLTVKQAVLMATVTACLIILVSMPPKMLIRYAIASVILFFPFFLLSPWMRTDSSAMPEISACIAQSGSIVLRSTCMLFITLSIISSLEFHEVSRGLSVLPLPGAFIALIVQLINQTMLLTEETARITSVLQLRSGTGVRGFKVVFAFPVVWMVRMIFRAERQAAAMAIRGYGIDSVSKGSPVKLSIKDLFAILAAASIFLASAILRVKSLL